MKRLIYTVVLAWILLAYAGAALASCYTTTYFPPNGPPVICTTCCSYGSCTVFCT